METENRSAGDHLSLLQALARAPHRYSFFQAVRGLERVYPDKPRVGTSLRLADDAFRIGQEPDLDFAPATLSAFRPGGGPGGVPQLMVRFQGLTGPNGPLPLHLTEFARERSRRVGEAADRTLVHFLNVFHHRLFTQFYRAWAEAQPTVSMDRVDGDNFGRWVASLAGYGMLSLRLRDQVPDSAKLAAAGLLARTVRNAEGLATVLADYFRVPAQVLDWHPHWLRLPEDAQTRIGLGQSSARLGLTAVLGQRVWDCQSSFMVVLGPLTLSQFKRFLPGQSSMLRLKDWVLNYSGYELGCNLRLVLHREQVPAIRLGRQGKLGHTTWLGRRTACGDSDDLELHVQ